MNYIKVSEDDYIAFVKWAKILKRDVCLFVEPPVETFFDDTASFDAHGYAARAGLWDERDARISGTVPKKEKGWWREWCEVREDWWNRYSEAKKQ